jgi:hypothetical protein
MEGAMRTVLVLGVILALSSASCFRGRGGGRALAALFGLAARVAVTAAAVAAARRAAADHRLPPQPAIDSCPPAPKVEVEGCVQQGIFRPHDSWSACAYYCVDHCEYHAGSQGKIRY